MKTVPSVYTHLIEHYLSIPVQSWGTVFRKHKVVCITINKEKILGFCHLWDRQNLSISKFSFWYVLLLRKRLIKLHELFIIRLGFFCKFLFCLSMSQLFSEYLRIWNTHFWTSKYYWDIEFRTFTKKFSEFLIWKI